MTEFGLNSVLETVPSTWTSQTYSGVSFVCVELKICTPEYEEIIDELRNLNSDFVHQITKIERVQHPFAYGRFLLRKEQLRKRNGFDPEVTRTFLKISESKLQEALEYNLDQRRTPCPTISRYDSSMSGSCCIVVKCLRNYSSLSRDSECYPEYVIHFD